MTNILNMTVIPSSSVRSAERNEGLGVILYRIAWPLFLFSAVLAALLTLSWALLLPRYARVEVSGKAMTAQELPAYKAQLTSDIALQQQSRRAQMMAVQEPTYEMLKAQRQAFPTLAELEHRLREQATNVTKRDDVIDVITLQYQPEEKKLKIEGDVRNVGPSSMTVLAQYAASLGQQTWIQSMTTPAFSREDDSVLGLHSPFTITLTLP